MRLSNRACVVRLCINLGVPCQSDRGLKLPGKISICSCSLHCKAEEMASGGSESTGFAVEFKSDCPHVQSSLSTSALHIDMLKPCVPCGNVGENWLCLFCSAVMCSRYVNSHMVEHNAQTEHMVVLSFSDLSVWCYGCDSYVSSPQLQPIIQAAALAKGTK